MRLIVRKVYRAFPELDRFSDAECEGFVRHVARRHPFKRFVVYFTLGVLSMVLIVLCLGLLALVVGQLPNNVRGMQFMVQFGIILLGTTLSVLVPMFGVSNIRTAWLRGKIQKHLSAIECAECEYSLIGLTIVDGGIFCPECGQRFDLAARGLTAADVLAKTPAPTE